MLRYSDPLSGDSLHASRLQLHSSSLPPALQALQTKRDATETEGAKQPME